MMQEIVMILFDNKIFELTEDENPPTKAMFLEAGQHKLDICFESGVTGTIAPVQTMDLSDPTSFEAVENNDGAYSTTSSDSIVVYGPGYFGFNVSSLAGGNVKVRADRTK
jgi:ApbE superfamily uncharacterized protein (UPF0280 family)